MRKRLSFLIAILLSLALIGCTASGNNNNNNNDNNPAPSYGTLTVANVTVEEGSSATITPVFSEQSYEITYSFEGDAISITGNTVTGNTAGVVTVTATTEHHSATFTVTVTEKPIDYGTLSVKDIVDLEVGQTAEIKATFSVADKAEPITYTFDGDAISIEDGVVTALKGNQTVTVTATTGHHSDTFTVTTKAIDYGTLTIANVTNLREGQRAKLFIVFSMNKYADDVEFEFEGNAISFDGGYVTALEGGHTVTVTATTEHHSTTFTVTTVADRGELTLNNVYAWIGYPASEFYPIFSKPECEEELSYEYDTEALEIDTDNNTIKAFIAGTYTVKATSAHFSKTFTVYAEDVDKNALKPNNKPKYDSDFASKANERANIWKNKGKDGVSTIFIGDSFFDGYWANFYNADYYGTKEAIRLGVSATTSYDWEQWSDGWLKNTKPRNIVMHMGTNNIYDDGDDVYTAVSALERMFTVMHANVPDAKIYWFSISQRDYDETKKATVSAVNNIMKTWCEERDWITYIHTVDTLTADMLEDKIHPKDECYYVFRDALAATDIEISDLPKEQGLNVVNVGSSESSASFDKTTATLTATSPANGKRAANYVKFDGEFYKGNFVVSGTITTNNTTGWIALFVNSNPSDTWFSESSELPAAAIVFPAGKAEIWGFNDLNTNDGIPAITGVNFKQFNYSVAHYNGKVIWQVGTSYKEISITDGSVPYFGITNESNSITATVKVDFDDDNIADAIEKIKEGQEVPDYGAKIDDISLTSDLSINQGTSVNYIYYKSGSLDRNFILEGKLDITSSGTNAHIQFGIDNNNNRVLLWDNNTQKTFKLCIPYTNTGIPEEDIYTLTSGQTLTINWKVIMTDDDLYFFIDDELKLVYTGLGAGAFRIGSEVADCKFYDMSALTLADDGQSYTTALEEYSDIIETYGNNATGKVRV